MDIQDARCGKSQLAEYLAQLLHVFYLTILGLFQFIYLLGKLLQVATFIVDAFLSTLTLICTYLTKLLLKCPASIFSPMNCFKCSKH